MFFDSLEDQRYAGGQIVALCTGVLGLAIVALWALLHTSGAAALAAVLLTGATALLCRSAGASPTVRISLGVAIMAQVSLLVGAMSGLAWQIDMHMTYFAALGVLAVFADWTVILVAAVTVALHHLTLSFLLPSLVFNGRGGLERVLVHAVLLIAEAVVLMWTAANNVQMLKVVEHALEDAGRAVNQARAAEQSAVSAGRATAAARLEKDDFAETARVVSDVVSTLSVALKTLASGDLTGHLDRAFSADFEGLRSDLNGTVAALNEMVVAVSATTVAVRSGVAELAQGAGDLLRRTEQQAARLEETAVALDGITSKVKSTSDGAHRVRSIVAAAKSDAERSSDIVDNAISAMGEIEASSSQIGQIIGVIDEIAFQTNLLALNAGVEAARAGDAGRGFAVVASEVRALAQRSAEAAKEIKALVSASATQVGRGVGIVGETGTALARIAAQIADINVAVSDIATSAQDQAANLNQINVAVTQMDQGVRQNAAMVEQSNVASQAVVREMDQLSRLVARFKVSGRGSGVNRPIRKAMAG